MKTTDNFKAIKQEILDRARAASACKKQYGRAYASETFQELCNVIKDNFEWCCDNKVLTTELLERYKADFATNRIYVNTNVTEGYLLATGTTTVTVRGNAVVIANDRAKVIARNKAKVIAYDDTIVIASDNTIVRACHNAAVKAYYNAMVIAHNNVTIEAFDNATMRVYDNTIVYVFDSSTVTVHNNATVRACDNAYCVSYYEINCRLSDNALHRVISTNTVYFANDNIKFQKQ